MAESPAAQVAAAAAVEDQDQGHSHLRDGTGEEEQEHGDVHNEEQTQEQEGETQTEVVPDTILKAFQNLRAHGRKTSLDPDGEGSSPLPVATQSEHTQGAAAHNTVLVGDKTQGEVEPSVLVDDKSHLLDERRMNRHLMDVESSFLPDPSPEQARLERKGIDDTYIYGGAGGPEHDESSTEISEQHASQNTDGDTSELDVLQSSPAAAAAQRTSQRTEPVKSNEADALDSSQHDDSLAPLEESKPSTLQSVRRPVFSHHGRQLSTTSTTFSEGGEGVDSLLNADYALHTGGAIPTAAYDSVRSRGTLGLSRLPSLGSIASSIDDEGLHSASRTRGFTNSTLADETEDSRLWRLDEERAGSATPPATPRAAGNFNHAPPTDTVIAQHVQNIRVPDTIAKEYREKHQFISPQKRDRNSNNDDLSVTGSTLPGRTSTLGMSTTGAKSYLTLKEQNSKIDRLSKENFDLKLKIHFLDQALQNRSDEGIKEMIQQNVQFQTDLANEKKENQRLKKRLRELEAQVKEKHLAPRNGEVDDATSRSNKSSNGALYADIEEEMVYMRERLELTERTMERMREEQSSSDERQRRMAEAATAGADGATGMWKDLLDSESMRRKQAEADNMRLQEEIARLKGEAAVAKAERQSPAKYRPHSSKRSLGGESDFTNGNSTTAPSTLVDSLKTENAELRRDLHAQTSMLTSRNRERERLQQEIEDLKLTQRRYGTDAKSVAGDSIFERSISRQGPAQQRPISRASGTTRVSANLSEGERDEYERKNAGLRDELSEQKMLTQDLERELNAHLDQLERLDEEVRGLKEELQGATEDLQALVAERDEALTALEEKEGQLDGLRDEAITTIEELEAAMDGKERELREQKEDFTALQREMSNLSHSIVQLEDDRTASQRKMQDLETELEEATKELEAQDKRLREAKEKAERMEIQAESHTSEINFLREEQEGDKLRIGELEDALNAQLETAEEQKQRAAEMEERMRENKRQREALDSQEKQQVQRMVDDLNSQTSKAREEVRRLRKNFSAKEVESTNLQTRLDELEAALSEAVGVVGGTRSTIVKSIQKLHGDLETAHRHLEETRGTLADKERLLRMRDTLLESSGLESRKLHELLDKERSARMADRRAHESAQRGQKANQSSLAQHESKNLELEAAVTVQRKKLASLEERASRELGERNNLLLALWQRLSTVCGQEWVAENSLVAGQTPNADVVARHLPEFSRNLVAALRTIEAMVGGFKTDFKSRIRGVEKDLWRDFQTLQHALDTKVRRLEQLERAVKETVSIGRPSISRQASAASGTGAAAAGASAAEIAKLRGENRVLRAELQFIRQNPPSQPPASSSGQAAAAANAATRGTRSPSITSTVSRASTLLRHHSTSVVELLQQQQAQQAQNNQQVSAGGANSSTTSVLDSSGRPRSVVLNTAPIQPSEQRWIHRLKELERRLKAEREARLLDRSGARKRLEQNQAENAELKALLQREKVRREGLDIQSGTPMLEGGEEEGEEGTVQ